MASPNLEHGYLCLEGSKLNGHENEASTKEGAFEYCTRFFDFGEKGASDLGDSLNDDSLERTFDMAIDMVVEVSVCVDKSGNRIGYQGALIGRFGNRIGKGKGFADREIEDLFNKNLIDENTPLVTTIHPFQLVDHIPMESHDKKLNMIVSTKEIIRI